ncbi:MAG: AgmX/PglI C-terminal domain-containing protein [Myxococcota bacterium]
MVRYPLVTLLLVACSGGTREAEAAPVSVGGSSEATFAGDAEVLCRLPESAGEEGALAIAWERSYATTLGDSIRTSEGERAVAALQTVTLEVAPEMLANIVETSGYAGECPLQGVLAQLSDEASGDESNEPDGEATVDSSTAAAALGMSNGDGSSLDADEAPEVRGSLAPEVIRDVIRSHTSQVRYCYEQALVNTPQLSGRLTIRFIISPTGSVQNAVVQSSTLEDEDVGRCVVGVMRRMQFPAPAGGGIVIVNYPFQFSSEAN